ncbi:MAG: hypothetical protein ACI9MC_001604, partial [Kiritimatiellia bacterium]
MKYTGRGIRGPGSDLLYVSTEDGTRIVIAFQDALRDRPALNGGLNEARAFLVKPGVEGLLPLLDTPEPGVFVYDACGGMSVQELLLIQRKRGEPAGIKAGLELMLQGAEVLADAIGASEAAGLYSHGDINPWRLIIDKEGYVNVIGMGLLNLTVLDFLAERADTVPADALRYAPPERIEAQDENALSDLYSLTLVAVELMTGAPVLAGDAEDILEPCLDGKTPSLIEKAGKGFSDGMLDLLCISTELKPDDRYRSAEEFISMVKKQLQSADGPGLLELLNSAREIDVTERMGPGAVPDEPAPKSVKKAAPVKPAPKPVSTPKPPPPKSNTRFSLPPALPKLPASSSLEDVQKRALEVVARAERLSVLVGRVIDTAEKECE